MSNRQPILVTGGTGFLGRHLVLELLSRGEVVRSFQRSSAPDLEALGVTVFRGELDDAEALDRAVAGCGAVFHVAAKAGVWGPWEAYFRANVLGTRAVVAACRRFEVPFLVHTSTPSVVFNGQDLRGVGPEQPYGRHWLCAYAETKALAEQEALAAHDPAKLRVCALRPHLIWGVGEPHFIPRIQARARRGKLRIVGEGRNRVDITHIRNAVAAHVLALEALRAGRAGGRAYFVSQGEPVVLWDWIRDLCGRLGLSPQYRKMSARSAYRAGAVAEWLWRVLPLEGEPPITLFVATELAKDHWFDIQTTRDDLGYRPEEHPTESGLAEIAEAYRGGGSARASR